jgi:hypothetical protein
MANKTTGYYVHFTRTGYSTSPCGPIGRFWTARTMAVALLCEPEVTAARVERKTDRTHRIVFDASESEHRPARRAAKRAATQVH